MSPRFDEVVQLKNLLRRRKAIIASQMDTTAVLKKMAIDQNIHNAFPWLLEVAGCFQPGDADEIAYAIDVLMAELRYTGDPRFLNRMLRAVKIMGGDGIK